MLALLRKTTGRVTLWLGGADLAVLLALLILVLGGLGFFLIASAVRAGETQSLDEHVLLALRNPADPADPLGPPWMKEVGRDLTAIGGIAFLVLTTVSVAGFLLLCRKYHALGLLLVAVGGGLALSTLLKGAIDRPRPTVVPHLS